MLIIQLRLYPQARVTKFRAIFVALRSLVSGSSHLIVTKEKPVSPSESCVHQVLLVPAVPVVVHNFFF